MDNVTQVVVYTNCVNASSFLLVVSLCGLLISREAKWKVLCLALMILSIAVGIASLRAIEAITRTL